ncbi:alpha/beta-hydrolase [Lojkania enalia]|uniref:Alpha/beta-hydrolase n=1 Tax=Lojkania enalia TaxID=147567 RepID=A0A9P4KD19_9PLEO|nr:alpha/beta-hydrolase [Didymosphaeria enalia]
MSKPQIVLVPGAWHTPAAFTIIIKKLEDAGYTVYSRQLPSVGNPLPPEDLTQDIAALQELVTEAISSGNDVLVVPHSWSGIVAGSALGGFGKKQREEKGEKGGIIKIAFMAAFVVPEGVSLMDAIQHQIPDWWDIKGEHTHAKDPFIFYNDLPAEAQQYHMSQLQSHSFGTKKAKSTGACWKEIPSWYLLCEDDQAVPAFAQGLMVDRVKEMGGDVLVERIKSGHSPFLSQPDYVVDWIRRATGENPRLE